MHLQSTDTHKTHLSHFHSYVSAYVTTQEMVKELERAIENAIKVAQEKTEAVIIHQDNIDHVFIVFPSGNIGLYRRVGMYKIVKEANNES